MKLMHRFFSAFLMLAVFCSAINFSLLSLNTYAADTSGVCGDNLTWSYADGTLTISGFGDMYDFATSGSAPWYSYRSSIKSIEFDSRVTSIGNFAFYSVGLTSFDIPNGIASLGKYSLSMGKLTSVTIPDSVKTIEDNAFSNTAITDITIPAEVEFIGGNAFYNTKSLSEINVDPANKNYSSVNGVLYNKDKTLLIYYPQAKTETLFSIPDGVKKISASSFNWPVNLEKILIPSSVEEIEHLAFDYCRYLKEIEVEDNNSYYISDENGILFNKEKTVLITFPAASAVTSYSIPETVTVIEESAFSGSDITDVVFPTGLKKIGAYAFESCMQLSNPDFPVGLEEIGDGAFYFCCSITEINLPPSIKKIGNNPFVATQYYDSRCDVDFIINGYLLEFCQWNLDEPPIGYSVSSRVKIIADGAFSNSSVFEISLPDGIEYLGEGSFKECRNLMEITIPYSVKNIYDETFMNSGIKKIRLFNNVEYIGKSAFEGCEKLTDVYYNGTEEEWNDIVIDSGNEILENVNIHFSSNSDNFILNYSSDISWSLDPATGELTISGTGRLDDYGYNYEEDFYFMFDTYFPWYSFSSLIKSVRFNKGISYVGSYSFNASTELKEIRIFNTDTVFKANVFSNCDKLEKAIFIEGIESVPFEYLKTQSWVKSVEIPSSVTAIEVNAFISCSELSDVYYYGSEEEWQEIEIYPGNDNLKNAQIHYLNKSSRLPGDANCDGNVNLKDVILIRRYLTGGWSAEIVDSNSDVDGSGTINLVDVALITRYLADWGVTLQ